MEHLCPRCGSAVDDSLPFCPNCEAPQVHFSPREAAFKSVVVGPAAALFPVYSQAEAISYEPLSSRNSFNWHGALRPALTAGAIAAVLSLLPLRVAFVLALPLSGFLCVRFYGRRRLGPDLSIGKGFWLGALSGIFGFAIFALLAGAGTMVSHGGSELRSLMIQAVRQAQARSADPQARQMMNYFATPQGLVYMMIFGLIFTCIVFVLLAGIGGAASAAMLRRKNPDSWR